MKLSIITISYNNIEGLERTIKSVISLKLTNYEFIIIDGGSTDGSKSLLESYSDHITYWVSEPDKGIYNAMNKGTEHASGDYLFFLNSGDIINDGIDIDKIKDSFSTNEDLICFNIKIQSADGKNTFIKESPSEIPDFRFFFDDTLPHQATFIKKDLLTECGGYSEEMKISSDWAFFIDMICLEQCSYKYCNTYFTTFYTDGASWNPALKEMIYREKERHLSTRYKAFLPMYNEWFMQRSELHKLRSAKSIKYIKKLGLLKWFKNHK